MKIVWIYDKFKSRISKFYNFSIIKHTSINDSYDS
jgi:hypothetical protein